MWLKRTARFRLSLLCGSSESKTLRNLSRAGVRDSRIVVSDVLSSLQSEMFIGQNLDRRPSAERRQREWVGTNYKRVHPAGVRTVTSPLTVFAKAVATARISHGWLSRLEEIEQFLRQKV